MNRNLVQITKKDGIFINGTHISHVLGYRLNNASYDKVMTMELELDVDDVEMLEHAPEVPEEDYVKLTVDLDETAANEKLNALEEKINQLLSALKLQNSEPLQEEFLLETSSTADLLSELKRRKALHFEYNCLSEESFIFGKYDGKIR